MTPAQLDVLARGHKRAIEQATGEKEGLDLRDIARAGGIGG
jgi:hypothetical protein